MQYTINYKCGHSEDQQLYGPVKDRESRISWAERQSCKDCYRAEIKAQEIAASIDRPALLGSEKQIAWAITIRLAAKKKFEVFLAMVRAANPANIPEGLDAASDNFFSNSSAKYWIETWREATGRSVAHKVCQNLQDPSVRKPSPIDQPTI